MKCIECTEIEYCGSISREVKSSSKSKLLSYLNSKEFICIDFALEPLSDTDLATRKLRLINRSKEMKASLK